MLLLPVAGGISLQGPELSPCAGAKGVLCSANSSDKEQLRHRYWSDSKAQVSQVPRVDFFGTEASLAS